MAKALTVGKYRGLQQISTTSGVISILALDHRNNLRTALRPSAPETVGAQALTEFKVQVIDALAPAATAALLDPEYGGSQVVAANALPGSRGLVMAVEETGYTGDPTARQSQLLPGWTVEKVRRMGASAVKLLVYYHPGADSARAIENLVQQVAGDCRQVDIPFLLEPLSYSPDPSVKKLPPHERREVVLETARRLSGLGIDILKAEFPVDVSTETDERVWADACSQLTGASQVPWVLLSASVSFEIFLRQVTICCQQGASGVAVGRAVWQEAAKFEGAERLSFLADQGRIRMQRVTSLCEALARPWTAVYPPPIIDSNWYAAY